MVAPAPFGGIESVVRALTTGPRPRGGRSNVAILLQSPDPHPFAAQLAQAGVPIVEIRCGRRRYAREARALAELARQSGADVIHTHNYHADMVGLWAARQCKIPAVTTVHGFSGGDRKNRLYEWLDRRLLRFFDAVICVSDATRSRVLDAGCPPERVRLITNGYAAAPPLSRLEARSLLEVDPGERVIGWVGRLGEVKGPDLLVRAIPVVKSPVVVVMVGDGPETGPVQALRAELKIPPDRLRLVGARTDAARLLTAFDVLVLSSRSEGMPMVLLEAMAARVPVVAFSVGGIPEALGNDGGWLVPAGDTAALARAIDDALANPTESLRRVGNAARYLDERFGLAQWLGQVESVYDQVIRAA